MRHHVKIDNLCKNNNKKSESVAHLTHMFDYTPNKIVVFMIWNTHGKSTNGASEIRNRWCSKLMHIQIKIGIYVKKRIRLRNIYGSSFVKCRITHRFNVKCSTNASI